MNFYQISCHCMNETHHAIYDDITIQWNPSITVLRTHIN